MDIKSSFNATILLGALALALLFLAGVMLGVPLVAVLAIAAAGVSYLCQWLVTQGLILAERAYGPEVTSDDDTSYNKLMVSSRFALRTAFILNLVAALNFGVGLGILAVTLWAR